MKKIMIIHHSGEIGGAGVSLYNTLVSLSKSYEVVVYCPSIPSDFSEYLVSKGFNVKKFNIPIGMIHNYSGGLPIYNPSFIKGIIDTWKYEEEWTNIIKYEAPDLVMVNSKTLSWFSKITTKLNVKSLCYVRETRKSSALNLLNNIQKRYLDNFSGVIFISQYDKNLESLKKARTAVVPNFLEISKYEKKNSREFLSKKFSIPENRVNILFVGGMLRIKGYDKAVQSLKYIKSNEVNLIVAGDPKFHYKKGNNILSVAYNFFKKKYEKSISKNIERYNLSNQIFKLGVQESMADIYTLGDILIFPANKPHQARPAFEAGVQSLPVIMPDFDNTKEYVQHNVNGLLFNKNDTKSLAREIDKLVENPDLRKKLGNENYRHTNRKHLISHSEKVLHKIINDVL